MTSAQQKILTALSSTVKCNCCQLPVLYCVKLRESVVETEVIAEPKAIPDWLLEATLDVIQAKHSLLVRTLCGLPLAANVVATILSAPLLVKYQQRLLADLGQKLTTAETLLESIGK